MMEDLWISLEKCWLFAAFFSLWPVVVAGAVKFVGQSGDGGRLGLLEALYYSLATYAGVSVPEPNPIRRKWPKLIHRLVGVLAWAFVTALFITTIT